MLSLTLPSLLLALAGTPPPSAAIGPAQRAVAAIRGLTGPGEAAPAFEAAARRVSNWRRETALDLHPRPIAALAGMLDADRPVVTRCVKLNNYWCIKRAGWNGEIGADGEGHVGFATADAGADAAVQLLRRYYLHYGRKSALDIVRRWAPAECGRGTPESLPGLALRGLGNTLRGRYLAARRAPPARAAAAAPARTAAAAPARSAAPRPQAAPRRPATARASSVPLRPLPTFRVPDIAAGMGERPASTASATLPRRIERPPPRPVAAPIRVASAPAAAPATPPPAASAPVCGDERRLQNYAAKIAGSLGLGPADDLQLFETNGIARANLGRVMLAMSAVELGILRARLVLVEGAIERGNLRVARDFDAP